MENLNILPVDSMIKSYPKLFKEQRAFNFQVNTRRLGNLAELPEIDKTIKVSEEVYWEKYYEDTIYEFNDGILEEKPVPNYQETLTGGWFHSLLRDYVKVYPTCKVIHLEMGFTLNLPHKKTIRKPDIGIILNSNPIELGLLERSYSGTVDFCIEILSDSNSANIARDTVIKKEEYCLAGVKEYLIIDDEGDRTVFYRLSKSGQYEQVQPINGILKSEVLPGFQFREKDLYSRPSQEEMSEDEVYKYFVFLSYQAEKQRANAEKKRADAEKKKVAAEKKKVATEKKKVATEKKKVDVERKRADAEKERADAEKKKATVEKQKTEERIKYLEAKLKSLGI